MADKKISDFTAKTSIDAGDLIEIETAGGNSRKVDAKYAGLAGGTSFPGSPATDDRFWRSDRGIEYYYATTQWLSVQILQCHIATQQSTTAYSATGSAIAPNPEFGRYDIYVERFVVVYNANNSTASNYFTTQLRTADGASNTNLGSGLSGQSDTISTWAAHSENINTLVASTVDGFLATYTETGAASTQIAASFTYRLVG